MNYCIATSFRTAGSSLCDQLRAYGIGNPIEYSPKMEHELKEHNGYFGIKILATQLTKRSHYVKNSDKVICLFRHYILDQAISLTLAQQTGLFSHSDEHIDRISLVKFDPARIRRNMINISKWNRQWRAFFEQNNIKPLYVCTENLKTNREQVFKKICNFLGADIPVYDNRGLSRVIQDYPEKQLWKEMYLEYLNDSSKFKKESVTYFSDKHYKYIVD